MKSAFHPSKWNYKRLDLASPKVMGIINISPDSFYDGGKYTRLDLALKQAEKMVSEGAAVLDLGAVSTRPFAMPVSSKDEWTRLQEILPALRKRFASVVISIDTYRSDIAEQAIDSGADMINDISGGQFDEQMFGIIAKHRVLYVMMHILGNPQTMQQNPEYENVVDEIKAYFNQRINTLKVNGVKENIILDPGFGFGKTVDHNYQLLHGIHQFTKPGFPVLAGLSRKSMINRVIGTKPENALNGTTALNMLALLNGANILRVHDVKEAMETIRLFRKYDENGAD
jgi:dihydropteroate synthase